MTRPTCPRALAATLGTALALAAGGAAAMTTTCADFMAMSPEDQMAEVAMMHDAMATGGVAAEANGDAMATDEAMAADDMAAIMAVCEGNPDMLVMDAMPADAMAPATN